MKSKKKQSANKKNRFPWASLVLVLVFFVGMSLLLYPTVSDYWNSITQSRAIAGYASSIEGLDKEVLEKITAQAQRYNAGLLVKKSRWNPSPAEHAEYMSLLDPAGNGIIGYIEIPKIKVSLPIRHTTDSTVLHNSIGHLEGSSLPIGGESAHCVLSGHRGLPSALLFSDLDVLKEGDQFRISVLGETLTYEVDQIRQVLPDQMQDLEIAEGKDYCTLVTCTPYGVNTHRLLVRGHRVDTIEDLDIIRVQADAVRVDSLLLAPLIAAPILLSLLLWLLLSGSQRKRNRVKKAYLEQMTTPQQSAEIDRSEGKP